ncbi:MAG TPA: NUDIX domain-containing protein [Allosphingosinicella sp.]
MSGDETLIRIVAAIAMNARGEMLMVRKRGTGAFMLPGGKPGAGESALDALEREVGEELDCGLDRAGCRPLGTFRAPAANEPGFTVEAELFAVSLDGEPRPWGEIDALIWVDPDGELPDPMAQLGREHALPQARLLKAYARSVSK